MSETNKPEAANIPAPVEGKYVFQLSANTRIRFNADGWVEEIGKGGAEDTLGTRLQGSGGTRLDDIFARRYYDLYTRVIILDIHPHRATDQSGASGVVPFKDLESGSRMYERVNLIIAIANHHFNMGMEPLKAV